MFTTAYFRNPHPRWGRCRGARTSHCLESTVEINIKMTGGMDRIARIAAHLAPVESPQVHGCYLFMQSSTMLQGLTILAMCAARTPKHDLLTCSTTTLAMMRTRQCRSHEPAIARTPHRSLIRPVLVSMAAP